MSISLDEVRHVANLARLQLSETELLSFQGQLNSLLGHFEDIQNLDVSGVAPKPHAVAMQNVFARDIAHQPLPREEALRNSADTKAGLFIVPTIIEE
ncbi:Asp-tRNA(Asn)/Glu-tRNA(Gln) amidotransferase GatCAB subunit C [bacterium]|nr:aspartyl/glutamyl-tRNA(Asn/Gln) amidotransferase subunit C [Armatimonadetes bacterium Uphvl-Ar1]MBA4291568.1 Asp-tRNA(Asn)/Glu-tRNA(Gln) amidotransferase GatCAB subunit C [bacterium]